LKKGGVSGVNGKLKRFGELYDDHSRRFLGRSLEPTDGLSEDEIKRGEERLKLRLPSALREYYLKAGALTEFNSIHNFILTPDELHVEDGFLMFMEENQGVVSWGLKISDFETNDPEAWQRNNTPPEEWFSEEKTFSELLTSMFEWYQECGVWNPDCGNDSR
jgi:hypothetical protein